MVEESDARPGPPAEDEANSAFSHEEGGSSGEETTHNGPASSAGGKKRKRIKYQKTSCELCKARKVKCDRAEPACSWCARHNRTCVYLERQKPGSRIGFTLELESKVNRVDALLQTLWRRVEDHIAHDHASVQTLSPAVSSHNASAHLVDAFPPPPPVSSADVNGQARPPALRASMMPAPAPTPTPTPSSAATAAVGSLPMGPPADSSVSCASSGSSSFRPPPDAASRGAAAAAAAAAAGSSSSLSGGTDLPPHDIIYTLVDLYFKHCNTWCPILDRKSTFGVFFGSTSLGEADRVLLQAIVATTLRFLRDARVSREMRAHYHAVSRQAVLMYAMEHVSVAALKALVILALDELGTSDGPRGWSLLALLAQNARQLDLCEESGVYLTPAAAAATARRPAVGPPESWIEDEGRRRLCWMVYLLDRYATVATTTVDFLLDDGRMRRVLPCSYDLFSRNVPVETRSLQEPMMTAAAVAAADGQEVTGSGPGPGPGPGSAGSAGPGPGPSPSPGYGGAADRAENLGSFSYHCEVLRILSRVHSFLRAPIDVASATAMGGWRGRYRALDGALDGWLQRLPSEYSRISGLCHSDPASRVANWFMLHSAYVTAVVRLHSAAAYPTVRSAAFAPSHYAMQRCLSAVQSLRDITQDVYEANGLDLVGPPFAFALWTAARLLLVHAAAVGGPVDGKVDFFLDVLGYVGEYWEVADEYARVLARVVQRARQGGGGGGGGDATLAAMRRSAHELVGLTGRTRRSGLDATTSRTVSPGELDSIDIFDFFNYPRLPRPGGGPATHSLVQPRGGAAEGDRRGVPDPEADWLGYSPPFH